MRDAEEGAEEEHNYVSWEVLTAENCKWSSAEEAMLYVRQTVSSIDEQLIANTFGKWRNGVRRRAWLRYKSGHYDLSTMKVGQANMKVGGQAVTVVESKTTPSMKADVYATDLVFDKDGVYMPGPSKCDCPNGWLFCSHMLGLLLVFRVMQQRLKWTLDDLIAYMPEPIKSLQSLPIPVAFVFGNMQGTADVNAEIATRMQQLAEEYRNYTVDGDSESDSSDEEELGDDEVEAAAAVETTGMAVEHSLDLCAMVDKDLIVGEARAAAANAAAADEGEEKSDEPAAREFTSKRIIEHNNDRVNRERTVEERLVQNERHERLYLKMLGGFLGKENSMWDYVSFGPHVEERQRFLAEHGRTVTIDETGNVVQ